MHSKIIIWPYALNAPVQGVISPQALIDLGEKYDDDRSDSDQQPE